MNTELDVIVVGTGPAGAMAARRCAQKGLRTLILEKEILPRYKACGSGITAAALGLLDFDLPEYLIEGECSSIQVRYGRYRSTISRPQRQVIFSTRSKFDAFLARKAVEAGAELLDGRPVTSVEVVDSHAIVRCGKDSYHAKIVIGADGAYSIVARNVRPSFGRDQIGIACDARLERDEIQIEQSVGVMDFEDIRYGYAWIFPRRDYLGVGIGAAATKLNSPKEKLLSVLRKWGVQRTDVETHWHVLPSGGFKRKTCSDRVILVGDAAGFVDPLFGGGIELAFRSACYAAETAQIAIGTGDCSQTTLRKYSEKCDLTFGKSLSNMLRLTKLLHRYPNMLIKPFAMSARLTELVFGNIAS